MRLILIFVLGLAAVLGCGDGDRSVSPAGKELSADHEEDCLPDSTAAAVLDRRGIDYYASTGAFDWTVLHSAARSGNLEIVYYLVEQGLDVNAMTADGWTVLHSAARSGNQRMVRWLVQAGARTS